MGTPQPHKGTSRCLGEVKPSEGFCGGFQAYDGGFIDKVVWPSQEAYVDLEKYTDIYVYGVTTEYHRNV